MTALTEMELNDPFAVDRDGPCPYADFDTEWTRAAASSLRRDYRDHEGVVPVSRAVATPTAAQLSLLDIIGGWGVPGMVN